MGIKITLDMQAIKMLEDEAKKAAEDTMNRVISEIKDTVPLDQGGLQNSIYVDQREVGDEVHTFIDHDLEYARYLYFGKLMVNPQNGSAWAPKDTEKVVTDKKLHFKHGRTDHWLEPYINGDKKDFVRDTFVEIYKKRTGV